MSKTPQKPGSEEPPEAPPAGKSRRSVEDQERPREDEPSTDELDPSEWGRMVSDPDLIGVSSFPSLGAPADS